jgi:hypothetical protein
LGSLREARPSPPRILATAGSALALVAALSAANAGSASAAQLTGKVLSKNDPVERAPVRLYRTASGGAQPVEIAAGKTRRDGSFGLSYHAGGHSKAVYYTVSLTQGSPNPRAVRLASILGKGSIPANVIVNERTTVAAGFAMAQFIGNNGIAGTSPGLQNAVGMSRNLVDPRTGGIASTLSRPPNGAKTLARPTLNSLADVLAKCARDERRCPQLFKLTTPRGGATPAGALEAVANIARDPSHNVRQLFRLALAEPAPYRKALGATQRPTSWSLVVRFDGDGVTMSGPGNFAIDARGDIWATNNYTYSADRFAPQCASDLLLKFKPNGRYAPGSPYSGGGVSGAGFGITLDPRGHVWLGNFGFSTTGCTDPPPPSNSVSEFKPSGVPVSGPSGYTNGPISWPQGTVSDPDGNIWIANCGNDTVTRYAGGDPNSFASLSNFGSGNLEKPFDIAFNLTGDAFVTAVGNSSVAVLNSNGTPKAGSPITSSGLDKPLGIAADSHGNMWVANSGLVNVPCPPPAQPSFDSQGGSLTLIGSDGQPRSSFTGGGLTVPWGIAVDGADNVWVANFSGRRLSKFCGLRPRNCPPAKHTGDPISPSTGYRFGGLTRNTGVAIDPSGNVWLANNWKQVPTQENPGGYQIVAFVGAAAPITTPLIGPPGPAR